MTTKKAQSEAPGVDDWLIDELFGKEGLVEPDGSGVMNMIRSAQDKKLARVKAKINRLITEAYKKGYIDGGIGVINEKNI